MLPQFVAIAATFAVSFSIGMFIRGSYLVEYNSVIRVEGSFDKSPLDNSSVWPAVGRSKAAEGVEVQCNARASSPSTSPKDTLEPTAHRKRVSCDFIFLSQAPPSYADAIEYFKRHPETWTRSKEGGLAVSRLQREGSLDLRTYVVAMIVAALLLFLALTAIRFYLRTPPQRFNQGYERTSLAIAAVAIGAWLAVAGNLTSVVRSLWQGLADVSPAGLYAISVLFFSPLLEELFFRGLVQEWFSAAAGRLIGIFVSVLAFSVAHVYAEGPFIWFVFLGVLFTIAKDRTGSVAITMSLHGLINCFVIWNSGLLVAG